MDRKETAMDSRIGGPAKERDQLDGRESHVDMLSAGLETFYIR